MPILVLEDVISMRETNSSGIQMKINKPRISRTSEINNDNATKDNSHTTKYSNNSAEQ